MPVLADSLLIERFGSGNNIHMPIFAQKHKQAVKPYEMTS